MIFAHIDVPGSTPWIDEFFGHPNEYWPMYLLVSAIITAIAYLLWITRDL